MLEVVGPEFNKFRRSFRCGGTAGTSNSVCEFEAEVAGIEKPITEETGSRGLEEDAEASLE